MITQPVIHPKYGEMARPPQTYVAPQLTCHMLSRRYAMAIPSMGTAQSSTAIGLANDVVATIAESVKAIEAVGATEPSAITTLPSRLRALVRRSPACSWPASATDSAG